jgi:hypothetical protein
MKVRLNLIQVGIKNIHVLIISDQNDMHKNDNLFNILSYILCIN